MLLQRQDRLYRGPALFYWDIAFSRLTGNPNEFPLSFEDLPADPQDRVARLSTLDDLMQT